MGPYSGVNLTHLMLTPESTPTHVPRATLCQSRPYPYARVDFIPQSGTKNLAFAIFFTPVF
jgi:hypothetical protein